MAVCIFASIHAEWKILINDEKGCCIYLSRKTNKKKGNGKKNEIEMWQSALVEFFPFIFILR